MSTQSASTPSQASTSSPVPVHSAVASGNGSREGDLLETASVSSRGSGRSGGVLSMLSRRNSKDGSQRRNSRDGLLKGDEQMNKGADTKKRKKSKKPNKKELLDGSERLHKVKSKDPPNLNLNLEDNGDQKDSELMFGHDASHLPSVNLVDDAFADWYRKTSGMHTVETWLDNYQKHPYAWGALIMIHGVDEVSARLRSKVENYAVYSAVLLSASVVLLVMPEINDNFLESHWVFQRIFLYSMLVSVASHLTSILLSMSFVNALNEAGRDADVIRMFGEGQGYLATHKCNNAFSTGLFSLAVGILDMILINFTVWDMLACLAIGLSIMYKLIPTSKKLFASSSLMFYWRFGRAEDNEDPFDLRIPMERVRDKARISERMYALIKKGEKEEEGGTEEKGDPDLEGGGEYTTLGEETVPVIIKEKGVAPPARMRGPPAQATSS
ncbi:hypothetical protein TrCOL_g11737 [Triparma columacea]|uniref:Uncharacterized protein n=1 Tax=Triparma columacea TaxID=722753 RepID=A0A9W7GA07_9STRA|nr:hypothetical protein TrCOL_g11737 [Triparma columacea]